MEARTAVPNEGDLAREFDVSPGTMRKALDLLEQERLITRRQGRGTFVNDQSSDELAFRFINIRGANGERIVGDVKSAEITVGVATQRELERLELQSGERVYRIRRMRFVDEQPFMLVEASVPASLFPGLEQMSQPRAPHRPPCTALRHPARQSGGAHLHRDCVRNGRRSLERYRGRANCGAGSCRAGDRWATCRMAHGLLRSQRKLLLGPDRLRQPRRTLECSGSYQRQY